MTIKILFIVPIMLVMLTCVAQKSEPLHDTEKNKQQMLLIVDKLFNQGDLTVADVYFEPGFAKEEKEFTKLIRGAFPDLIIVVDIQVAEENLVAARWTATGTHRGAFLGVPPTNRQVSWKGSWFWTFENVIVTDGMGKGTWDALGLLKQLQSK